jgi:hypothetical protein
VADGYSAEQSRPTLAFRLGNEASGVLRVRKEMKESVAGALKRGRHVPK